MTDDIVRRLRRVKSTSCSHIAGEFFVNFQLMLPSGADRTISALANVMAGCITIHSEAADEIERLRKERDEARREVCAYVSGRYGKDVVTLDRAAALDEANRRGWDCFKEVRDE